MGAATPGVHLAGMAALSPKMKERGAPALSVTDTEWELKHLRALVEVYKREKRELAQELAQLKAELRALREAAS